MCKADTACPLPAAPTASLSPSNPSAAPDPESPRYLLSLWPKHGPSSRISGYHEPITEADVAAESAFRHSGWAPQRRRIRAALVAAGAAESRIHAFDACGLDAWVYRSLRDPDQFRVAASYCHDRFCVPCQHSRSALIASNLIDAMKDRDTRLVTLTMRHDDAPLGEQIDRLYKCFRRLRGTKFWKSCVVGGVAVLEVHHTGRTNGWHPHLHVIVEGEFINRQTLAAKWHGITETSYVVHVRKISGSAHVARYVSKYLSKPVAGGVVAEPRLLAEAVQAMKGRRYLLSFGTWREISFLAKPDDGDDWVLVGPLLSFVDQARCGDADAYYVLKAALQRQPWYAPHKVPPGGVLKDTSPETLELIAPPEGRQLDMQLTFEHVRIIQTGAQFGR